MGFRVDCKNNIHTFVAFGSISEQDVHEFTQYIENKLFSKERLRNNAKQRLCYNLRDVQSVSMTHVYTVVAMLQRYVPESVKIVEQTCVVMCVPWLKVMVEWLMYLNPAHIPCPVFENPEEADHYLSSQVLH